MKFKNKQALLDQIVSERATFECHIQSLSRGQYYQPGVWGDDWTVKDLVAHLYEWQEMFLDWYATGLMNEVPDMPATGFKWNETPRLNHSIWNKYKNTSWKNLWGSLSDSYDKLLQLAQALPEKKLLEPGAFKWTGRYPLSTYLSANSCSHYRVANKILKRWLRSTKSGLT